MLAVWARRGQIALGSAYLALGALMALPAQHDSLSEPLLLIMGGLVVLIGTSGALRSPITACALVWVGGLIGFAPAIGTVILPLLALFVLDATLVATGTRMEERKAQRPAAGS